MPYSVPAYRCVLVREESRDILAQEQISCSSDAIDIAIRILADSPSEQFVAVLLDTKNRVIGYHVVTVGVLDASLVHPRETFRAAIIANASSIIIAHNHPSGDVTPSKEDYAVFRRIVEAGQILGIDCLDSIIVSDTKGLSMQEEM